MPAKIFWFLPTDGESRSIVGASHASAQHTIPEGYRARNRRYLAEIGRAADRLGYEGVLTPTGTWREDAGSRPRPCSPKPNDSSSWRLSAPDWCRRRWLPSRRRPSSGSPTDGCCSTFQWR